MNTIKGKVVQSTETITIDGIGDVVQHTLTTDEMQGSMVIGMEIVNTRVKYRFVSLPGSYYHDGIVDLPMGVNIHDGEYYISNYTDLTQVQVTEFELMRHLSEMASECVMVSERGGKSYYMTSPPDISSNVFGRVEYIRISVTVALAKAGVFIPRGISIYLIDGTTDGSMFDYNSNTHRITIRADIIYHTSTKKIRDEFNKALMGILPVLEDSSPLVVCPYTPSTDIIFDTRWCPYPLSKE